MKSDGEVGGVRSVKKGRHGGGGERRGRRGGRRRGRGNVKEGGTIRVGK